MFRNRADYTSPSDDEFEVDEKAETEAIEDEYVSKT